MKNKFFVLLMIAIISCSEKNTSHSPGILAAEEPSVIDVMPETYTDIDNQSEPEETWTEEQRVEYSLSEFSHIANEDLREIAALYRAARWNISVDSRLAKKMTNLLLDFLKQEENWSIDVENELSFMDRYISEDGMVRIYNWAFEYATGDTFHTILQYKSELDTINVVQIHGWSDGDFEQFRQLGFNWGAGYGVGFKIAEQTYLLWAFARAGSFMFHASFVAVRLLNGKIEPYLAFNGDNSLGFHVADHAGSIIKNFHTQFNEKPFSIRIFYNPGEINSPQSGGTLDFIFNGSEFMGDYNRLNEVVNFRRF